MDITIPAPTGGTETAAPQVTAPTAEQSKPQAEQPAGNPQATQETVETPAGSEAEQETASGDQDPSQDKPKTWKEKRAERNRQRWQEYKQAKEIIPQRLHLLERELAALKGAAPPDFAQITDPQEELAERTAWKVRQQSAQEREAVINQERQLAAFEAQQKMSAAWMEQVAEARERIPDFEAVVMTDKTPIHQRAVEHIVESDVGAEIAYWLGKNPDEATRLYQAFETDPRRALKEFGRIEARLSAPPPKTTSTAPRPAPILRGGTNPLAFDANKATPADMEAHLRKAGIIR